MPNKQSKFHSNLLNKYLSNSFQNKQSKLEVKLEVAPEARNLLSLENCLSLVDSLSILFSELDGESGTHTG